MMVEGERVHSPASPVRQKYRLYSGVRDYFKVAKIHFNVVVEVRRKVGAERCEYVLDVHTSEASKRLKVVLLHL
jgi:hypothetical protein